MGTELYTVRVEIFKKDRIKSYSCDCPYDGDLEEGRQMIQKSNFRGAFERKGDVVGNRREYADFAITMEKIIRDIPEGKDEIIAVAEELIRKSPAGRL